MVTVTERPRSRPRRGSEIGGRLDAAGWGAFFLWVGYALLAEISIGWGLFGVGVITLLGQAARRAFAVPVEGFWLLVGIAFLVGGLWNVLAVDIPLAPVVMLVIGAILVLGALLRSGEGDERGEPREY